MVSVTMTTLARCVTVPEVEAATVLETSCVIGTVKVVICDAAVPPVWLARIGEFSESKVLKLEDDSTEPPVGSAESTALPV